MTSPVTVAWPVAPPPAPRRWLAPVAFGGLIVIGLLVLGFIALMSGAVPFAFALVLALIPVPVIALGLLALDRYEPEPAKLMLFTFLWGATAATLIALVLNTSVLVALRATINDSTANFLTAALSAPLVEECAKGAVLLILVRMRRREIDGPIDGIVYGGLVGLGFAMTENVLYYSAAAMHGGTKGLVGTFILRGILSPLLHPLFTSATGIGLGYAAISRSRQARWLLPILGLLVAMGLHATWNASTSTGHVVAVYFFVMLPAIVLVLAIATVDRRRSRRLMRRILPGYVHSGWLQMQDLAMLESLKWRRRARAYVKNFAGPHAARAMRDYQVAATELVHLHDRTERRQFDPATFATRQQALLRQLQAARYAFSAPVRPWR
ncbi:MAG: PrsW family intramembrane metalloprotease [Mycobacteriales bacterium]